MAASKSIHFEKAEIELLAHYICEVERQGMVYTIEKYHDGWSVELTGGC